MPDVIAMKNWKTERSGYLSPIVAETEGNHSWGYPCALVSLQATSLAAHSHVILVFDNLVVVQVHSGDQCSEESSICDKRMNP